jgi:hypothetical protein
MYATLEEDVLELEVMVHEAESMHVLERAQHICSIELGRGEGQET